MTDIPPGNRDLAALTRPSGAFAMVAIDQREALRGMIEQATGASAEDQAVTDFKVEATRVLSPYASGVLLDVPFAVRPVLAAGALAEGCGLIVAVDELLGPRGVGTEDTRLDDSISAAEMTRLGAAALKFLLIWRPDENPTQRRELVTAFLERAHSAGLPGIVEVVVKPPRNGTDFDREDAVLSAAREVAGLHPDLYKAEVPLHGRGDLEQVRDRCRALTAAVPCPWVVLSSGVTAEDFPTAVRAACAGGASGFLAGRAVWADCVGRPDLSAALAGEAVPRLQRLIEIVDETVGGR